MKIKRIIIINEIDYKKVLRKISLYKSILYFNTFFELKTSISDKNIEFIIAALNIKNRKRRIEYVYKKSCNLIDEQMRNRNICGFKKNKCFVQRKIHSSECNGCCRRCLYQTNKGCSTNNLACKLFNCSEVTSRYEVMKLDDLKLLKLLSLKNRFIVKSDYFSTEKDVLKDLYSYSLIYSTIRAIYRIIKNLIYFNKKSNRKML